MNRHAQTTFLVGPHVQFHELCLACFPKIGFAKLVPHLGRLRYKFYGSTALTANYSLGFPSNGVLHMSRLDLPLRCMIRYEGAGFAQVGDAQVCVV
jgi:hypothetical protein